MVSTDSQGTVTCETRPGDMVVPDPIENPSTSQISNPNIPQPSNPKNRYTILENLAWCHTVFTWLFVDTVLDTVFGGSSRPSFWTPFLDGVFERHLDAFFGSCFWMHFWLLFLDAVFGRRFFARRFWTPILDTVFGLRFWMQLSVGISNGVFIRPF